MKHGIPIFEVDTHEDLRFERERKTSIHSLDDTGMALYCGTLPR